MMLGYTSTPSDKQELKNDIFKPIIVTIIPLLLLLLILNPFHKAIALSPAFELQELINENRHWVQTYGNSDANLKSNYTDILAVNYISDGKTLNATFWLSSAFKNSSASSAYNQPFRKLTYGMLIDADSNTKTGYNGADYDFYVEVASGKLTAYLYQLSSTGVYKILKSINLTQSLADPNALRVMMSHME